MSDQIQFELVSPEKLLLSKAVAQVTMPGDAGYFGVLAGHAPIIASIGTGVVDVCENNSSEVSERIFVAGGFAEVTETMCTLLAEIAVPVSELDRTQLEQEISDLNDDLSLAVEDKKADIEAQIALAKSKLEFAK